MLISSVIDDMTREEMCCCFFFSLLVKRLSDSRCFPDAAALFVIVSKVMIMN